MRLLIAEDNALIVECLRMTLQGEHEIVGFVDKGQEVVRKVQELQPEILLLDISLPGRTGFAVAGELRQKESALKIIFLTGHRDAAYVAEARRVGGNGYVLKQQAQRDLLEAIAQVTQGGFYLSPGFNMQTGS